MDKKLTFKGGRTFMASDGIIIKVNGQEPTKVEILREDNENGKLNKIKKKNNGK